jgi:hypothetical protein
MIEASSLGGHADTILAITRSIVKISAEWRENTDQSGNCMHDILKHVEQTNLVMAAFSESRCDKLHAAQELTRNALDYLKAASDFAICGRVLLTGILPNQIWSCKPARPVNSLDTDRTLEACPCKLLM